MGYTSKGTPFVSGNDTSEDAAWSMESVAGRLRAACFRCIQEAGEYGATCDEVEVALGMKHQTASARIRELVKMGAIYITEDRRKTRSGRTARVYRAAPPKPKIPLLGVDI